jgi:PAS domain S-box-containing protein
METTVSDHTNTHSNTTPALDQSTELYRRIVETTTEGVVVINMERKITFVNPGALEMFGYSREEMTGHLIAEFLDIEEARKRGIANLDMTRKYRMEVCFLRKDKTQLWVTNNSNPIFDDHGVQIGVLGLLTDISEHHHQQLEIQKQNDSLIRTNLELAEARQSAEESTRLKSEFLATMSHELRTPLNAIIGYTEIQLAGMTGDLNEEQRDYLLRTLVNAENLLRLINDVLDLSKIEARRITIIEKPFVLTDLIKNVVYQMKGLAEGKLLALETVIDPAMPETVVGDYVRIKQMLVNLVSNAVKFTDQGRIEIRIERAEPDQWLLHVTDTGIGIPTHAQEYIFDEFRQVDGTSQRKHSGTGLGLAIVRQLATLMGGTIRVKSRIGEGSTFTITLPFRTEPVPATPA